MRQNNGRKCERVILGLAGFEKSENYRGAKEENEGRREEKILERIIEME